MVHGPCPTLGCILPMKGLNCHSLQACKGQQGHNYKNNTKPGDRCAIWEGKNEYCKSDSPTSFMFNKKEI